VRRIGRGARFIAICATVLRDGTLTEDWCGPAELRGVDDLEGEVW